MMWVGFAAIAVAAVWLLIKLYVAYGSAGGTNMAVVYDAAVYPPLIAAGGLFLVLYSYQIPLAFWTYVVIWAVTTGVAAGAIRLMEEIGDRPR